MHKFRIVGNRKLRIYAIDGIINGSDRFRTDEVVFANIHFYHINTIEV